MAFLRSWHILLAGGIVPFVARSVIMASFVYAPERPLSTPWLLLAALVALDWTAAAAALFAFGAAAESGKSGRALGTLDAYRLVFSRLGSPEYFFRDILVPIRAIQARPLRGGAFLAAVAAFFFIGELFLEKLFFYFFSLSEESGLIVIVYELLRLAEFFGRSLLAAAALVLFWRGFVHGSGTAR